MDVKNSHKGGDIVSPLEHGKLLYVGSGQVPFCRALLISLGPPKSIALCPDHQSASNY